MIHRRLLLFGCLLSILALSAVAPAAVKLPAVFSDHMVLQRDMVVPVWGTADAGEQITVEFAGQSKSATADDKGKWSLKLDPLAVSAEPREMTIQSKTQNSTTKISDVLVGDVWLGSGQSNMQITAAGFMKNDPALTKIAGDSHPMIRLLTSGRKGWELSTPESNPQFSALLFSFGVPLQEQIKVPLGLMVGAVGGTPSGRWLSPEMLAADEPLQQQVKTFAAANPPEKLKADYEAELAKWEKAAAAAKAKGAKEPRKPLPPTEPGQATSGKVGDLYAAHVLPYVPFAIRGVLWDQGESGTQITGVDQFTLMGALIKGWRNAWGQDFPFIYVQKPSGGGCAFDPADPITAKASPFAKLPAQIPADKAGEYRETHIHIMTHPNTAMVTTSDLGSGTHPILKSSYGLRAARVAMGFAYKQPIEYYGPIYASQKIEANKIRLTFTHTGQGLTFKGGDKLQGFMIAGPDKKFAWADAVIDGDTIVVSSDKVGDPVAVRYAWDGSFPWANLFNKDGLPAQTFRTDGW